MSGGAVSRWQASAIHTLTLMLCYAAQGATPSNGLYLKPRGGRGRPVRQINLGTKHIIQINHTRACCVWAWCVHWTVPMYYTIYAYSYIPNEAAIRMHMYVIRVAETRTACQREKERERERGNNEKLHANSNPTHSPWPTN